MKVAYFDCFSGAAGDMIVAALLDAGLELENLRAALGKLKLSGYAVSAEKVRRGGIAGTQFCVNLQQAERPRRRLGDVVEIIDSGALPGRAGETAKAIFHRLAAAEAKVHGTDVDEVHFHELGAVDSILDIVSAAVGVELLGIEQVLCSPIPLGGGTVQGEHGALPVPAPATAELLTGAAIAEPAVQEKPFELTTPTAAAVLTTLSAGFGPAPAMELSAVGYGAGSRDAGPLPNLLRVFIGSIREAGQLDTAVELSANLDDCTGEVIGATIQKLLAAGALDAWCTPIYMKKSRPGWMLSALCLPGAAEGLEEVLLSETTTLGVRKRLCGRRKLLRSHVTVETPYGPVRVKTAGDGRNVLTASPEFSDAQAAAEAHGVPVKEVMAAAIEAYRNRSR